MTVPLYNLTDTWNNIGTVFTAIQMNVTNTASAAASLLLDLQIGGSSIVSIRKDGLTLSNNGIAQFAYLQNPGTNSGTQGFQWLANGDIRFWGENSVAGQGFRIAGPATDTVLSCVFSNNLAILKGSTAQGLQVYNTISSTTDYERGAFDWTTTANTLTIGTQKLGTGSARGVNLISAAALLLSATTSNLTISAGVGQIGISSAAPVLIDTCLAFPNGSTPATPVTTSTYTQTGSDVYITFNASGTCTLTLFNPATSHAMSFLFVRTIANQAVVSASSNIVPLAGGAAGTAILAATAGKWAMLVADGSAAWQIIAAN